MPRNRLVYFGLIVITVVLGLVTRRIHSLPQWIHLYIGDVLWAMMAFWGVGFIFRHRNSGFVAIVTLIFSILIELSQLYHAEGIDAIRSTTLGGLVLGFGFLWSDIICYTIGVALSWALEHLFFNKH